jgi:ABC-type sugar transport system ATPase subunit
VVALRLRDIGKRFGGTRALAGVSFDVAAGTVHALVGENGAGKSTCLGILAGRVVPSEGEVELFGRPARFGDPRASRRAGVYAIYQELTIAPDMTTQANVFLGQTLARHGILRERDMRRRFRELCEELGVDVPSDVPAGALSVGSQQLVEIMRALVAEPRVVLFDEPTASLAAREREVFYGVLRRLRERGTTVVLVSHNLDEVLALSDEVTVFRNGRLTASRPAARWGKAELVHAMVGDVVVGAAGAHGRPEPRADAAGTVRIRGLRVDGVLHDVDLEVRPGEIVGLGGLVGSGRTTLLRALAGDVRAQAGSLEIGGRKVRWPSSVPRARRLGIFLIPEDRKAAGVIGGLPAADNILLADLASTARFGVISRSRARAAAAEASRGMGFAEGRLGAAAGTLSGGNQQKLLLARAAHCKPSVLLADEPTRGVDIGAKAEIVRTLKALAASGMAVITVSSELEELEGLCDRVVVLSRGEVVGEIDDPQRMTVESILQLAFRTQETH